VTTPQRTPSRPMTRRHFVWLAVTAFFAAVVAYVGVTVRGDLRRHAKNLYWSRHAWLSPEDRIRREFHYLQLDDGGVAAFVGEYEKHRGPISRFRHPEDDLFDRFLLSTDFFRNGADESRPVRFVLFYDPYISPCWNPCVPAA
jgi:hypothetical protein